MSNRKQGLFSAELCFSHTQQQVNTLQFSGLLLPAELRGRPVKRRAEYLAGRWCARECLRQAGLEDTEIVRHPDGRPGFPAGYTGSVSHSGNRAVAVMASSAHYHSAGIDTETWLTPQEARQLMSFYLHGSGQAVWQASGLPLERFITLAFSASESVFKAISPAGVRFADIYPIELKQIDTSDNTLQLTATMVTGDAHRLSCQFAVADDYVKTLVLLPKDGAALTELFS